MPKKNKLRVICDQFNIDGKLCAKLLDVKSLQSMQTMLNPSYEISEQKLTEKIIKLLRAYQVYMGILYGEIDEYIDKLLEKNNHE